MKETVFGGHVIEQGTVVASLSAGVSKFGKVGRTLDADTGNVVCSAMKNMLGDTKAVSVRVVAS